MKSEALTQFQHFEFIVVALFIFFALFIGIVIWVFRKSRKKFYKEMAQLPMEEARSGGQHE